MNQKSIEITNWIIDNIKNNITGEHLNTDVQDLRNESSVDKSIFDNAIIRVISDSLIAKYGY